MPTQSLKTSSPSPMQPIKAVVFDVDDTLCDSAAAFGKGIVAATRVYIPDLPAAQYPQVIKYWRSDPNGHYRQYTRGEIGFEEQRHLRANELHARFGGPYLDDSEYEKWAAIFWGTFTSNWRSTPDVEPCLTSLSAHHYRLGALSNAGADLQTRKLEACGITSDEVPLLVSMDTFGFGKPDPRVFLEATRKLNLEPSEVAYVGDEFDIDAQAACAAGLQGFWIDRPSQRLAARAHRYEDLPGADKVIRIESLTELPSLLLGENQ
ncbi:MAG: HAD family hydrolase [Bifidobacteriaceae bacterium]|nr:HAD family hydrolase [Bifidobacteriaceae bacterium]MCI1979670.1 HAD family hydrolase [Bifidobacteriaceae bacterium]